MDPISGVPLDITPKLMLRGSYSKTGAYKRVYTRTRRDRANNVRKIAKTCMLRLVELKHSTTNVVDNPVAAAGSVNSLSILSQGTSAVTRIGQ